MNEASNTAPGTGAAAVVVAFHEHMQARDWEAAARCVAADVDMVFVHTGERFRGDAWLAMNRDYPEGWSLEVVEALEAGDRVATRVKVTHDPVVLWCAGFYTVAGGRIVAGQEHWVQEAAEAVPGWREAP